VLKLGVFSAGLTVALIIGFWFVGLSLIEGFHLELGSIGPPTPHYVGFTVLLVLFGLPIVGLVAHAVSTALHAGRVSGGLDAGPRIPDSQILLVIASLGFLAPLGVRTILLRGAPLTDDEAAYRFSAELLASYRLWVPSPPMKLFFDNNFLINDGRLFGQYFLGWPALLAIGVKLGVPWLANPLLSAATGLGVFLVAREFWGSAWARCAGALFLLSPFVSVCAATQLSHPAALFACTWALYGVSRVSPASGGRWSALVSLMLSLAFWTRPTVAVAFGPVLLTQWALRVYGTPRRLQHISSLLAVAVPLAALFLLYNWYITGSPFSTGYHLSMKYMRQNGFRYAVLSDYPPDESFFYIFRANGLSDILAGLGHSAFRLSFDAFGWPLGLGLALLAWSRPSRWLWGICVLFFLAHVPVYDDGGIDTFGPVHFYELMLPLVLLSTDGLRRLRAWGRRTSRPHLSLGVFLGLTTVCASLFTPVRWRTVATMIEDISRPIRLAESVAPRGAVVFALRPFAPPCAAHPGRHFVFSRPNNSPAFDGSILWANHVSVRRDRDFLEANGNRPGFILTSSPTTCTSRLVPLEEATEQEFPAAVTERPFDFLERTLQ
jgi:hypothetical protein